VADRYLLESGAPDGYLLEDGTGVFLMEVQGPFQTCQVDSIGGRDSRRYQLGAVDFIPNLLLTTLAISAVLRPPFFAQKQDLSDPSLHVQAQVVVNRLPLSAGAVASPFLPHLSEAPDRLRLLPADTSRGTPKTLYEDVSFAPAQSEFQTIPFPRRLGPDTSYRNTAILSQPAATPFVPEDFSNIQWVRWLPLDTSRGTPTPLYNPSPFWGAPQVSPPVFPRTLPDTSMGSFQGLFIQPAPPFTGYVPPPVPAPERILPDTSLGTPAPLTARPFVPFEDVFLPLPRTVVDTSTGSPLALLTTPPVKPFANETYNVARPPFNVVDTSKGTPLPLLTAPVFPPFYQTDFPAPIEYRFLSWKVIDPQIYPEFIPPPLPPVVRVEIDGGVPRKHKSAKQEREEFLDEVIGEVLAPAKPAPALPEPLKPVLEARPVVAPKPGPLSVPPILEPPDDTDEIIAALIALGLF